MNKIYIICFLSLNSITAAYCQTSETELELKIEKLNEELIKKDNVISTQTIQVDKLKSDIEYYKESLDLLNTTDVKESDNIVYRINSIKGNYNDGVIIVEGLIENKGITGKFQPQSIDIYDLKGNKYKANKFLIGDSKLLYVDKLERNLPIKFRFEFNGVLDETPVLKALIFNYYRHAQMSQVKFENQPVTWD